ncbi:MAG: hypothetical protein V3U71_11850 [Cocleimonas sp.]
MSNVKVISAYFRPLAKSLQFSFTLVIVFFLLYSGSSLAAPLQFLTKSTVPETAFENTAIAFVRDFTTTNSLDDSVDRNVGLGFTYPFGGVNYTTVNIVSNGFLRFTAINNTYFSNNTLANIDAAMPHAILPYWDDLNPATGGNITYGRFGSAPNRRFVVTWNNVPHYNVSGQYSFQVVLYEDGGIRFRYDATSDANGNSNGGATIGVIENNTFFDQHSLNTPINQNQDILYTRPTDVSIKKISCAIRDPINITTNPKRVPGATIRYAIEISNADIGSASNIVVDDSVPATFDIASIQNLQIINGACDCTGVVSASANPPPGTGNGVHPIKLNFGTLLGGSAATPTKKCGYFEVNLQ